MNAPFIIVFLMLPLIKIIKKGLTMRFLYIPLLMITISSAAFDDAKLREIFAEEAMQNPKTVNATVPSSTTCGKIITQSLPDNAVVLELGAATGPITEHLVATLGPDQLVILEINPRFCEVLRERFPKYTVICGDAADLEQLLPDQFRGKINTVVSTMPFWSDDQRTNVFTAIQNVSTPKFLYMQTVYGKGGLPFNPKFTESFDLAIEFRKAAPRSIPQLSIIGYRHTPK
jgi:phospholipid N-methyltransferase